MRIGWSRRDQGDSVPRVNQPIPTKALIRWAESLSAIARTGLGFTQSLYERERFEEVLRVAGDIKAAAELFAGPFRAWLDADRNHWIRESSQANGVPHDQAEREFDQALDLLSLLDRVRLVVRISPDARWFTQELSVAPHADH